MATPHNKAELHDIAPVVLLPGDPLRAQYVAEQYLENSRQVTGVRNMLGFTGTYQGIPVSVMGSGMGGPSAGIYSYELFSFYGVERIIRIGTAGGLQENTKPGTLVFAMTASALPIPGLLTSTNYREHIPPVPLLISSKRRWKLHRKIRCCLPPAGFFHQICFLLTMLWEKKLLGNPGQR